jgi:diguanylate cyclase (GGDEF)-like protein
MTTLGDVRTALDCAEGIAQISRLSDAGQVQEALALGRPLLCQARLLNEPAPLAECLRRLSFCSLQAGLIEDGLQQASEAAQLFKQLGDLPGEAQARAGYAWLLMERAESEKALSEALLALQLARDSGDDAALAFALNAAGIVYWLIKQPDQALMFLDQAVALARPLQTPLPLGRYLTNVSGAQGELAATARARGDMAAARQWHDRAVATAQAALTAARTAGDLWIQRIVLCNCAELRCHAGDYAGASDDLAVHDALPGTLDARALVQYRFTRGLVLLGLGQFDAAIAAFEASLSTEQDGDIEQAVVTLEQLARAFEAAGRYQDALTAHRRFHALYVRMAEQAVQRRASVAALGLENDQLRAQAAEEQRRADELEREKLSLMREAEQLSRTVMQDSLTQLANRRRLEQALQEALADGRHYVLAMLDIDNFKRINDTHSHLAGDDVLRKVAQILRSHCRENDLPARYGGEEFAVLLRVTDRAAGKSVCDRILDAIGSHDWRGELRIPGVTISIGIASSSEGATPRDLLAIADQRLYQAKAQGRNRVVDA